MFGLGKRKCKECGAELAEGEAMGDRTDDLMKSSALGSVQSIANLCARCRVKLTKSTQSLAMNLHVIEARRLEEQAKSDAKVPTAQPSAAKERTIAHISEGSAAPVRSDYQPGGGYKTEEEKSALFGAPSFDEIGSPIDLILWLVGTGVGRRVAVGAFIFIAVIFNSFDDDDYQPVNMPVPTEAPRPTSEPPLDEPAMPPEPVAPPSVSVLARPANSTVNWIIADDYPARALDQGREGSNRFVVTIDEQGAVTDCIITESSGNADLDKATCSAVSKRARFERAPAGYPDRTYASRVQWRIPED